MFWLHGVKKKMQSPIPFDLRYPRSRHLRYPRSRHLRRRQLSFEPGTPTAS